MDTLFPSDYVLDVEHIRIALGLEKMSLVGHSLGAIISILYAATYPERVDKAFTIDSIIPPIREMAGEGNVSFLVS